MQDRSSQAQHWDIKVDARPPLIRLNLDKIYRYRDLIILLVKRNIIIKYKQTVLGPLWLIIRPLLTTATFVIVFNNIANLSTNGVPPVLFQMSGVILWTFFASNLKVNSNSFGANAGLFGKVYFPRAVVPLANTFNSIFELGIQFIVFLFILCYFIFFQDFNVDWDLSVLMLFVYMAIAAVLSVGVGLIISSLTYKYRDLQMLVSFGVQLFMYATPVIYTLSTIPEEYQSLMLLNPVASLIEGFREVLIGAGSHHPGYLLYSACVAVALFVIGLVVFNRTERNFMDTV
jgi:lipopolysaccharide transport system permease protein